MTDAPQIKTGRSVTIIQLVLAVGTVIVGIVGAYVHSQIRLSQFEDRLIILEKAMADSKVSHTARDVELKAFDERVDKNTQDIEILKTKMEDLKK